MIAATKAPAPFYTGWCGLRLPPESHLRCAGSYAGQPCACDCHRPAPAPELLALPDALNQLCHAVCSTSGGRRIHDPICQTVRHHLTLKDPA